MLQRPKPFETEEDLLKQEEEFLKAQGKGPSKRIALEPKAQISFLPVGNVVERKPNSFTPCTTPTEGSAFPEPFVVTVKGKSKKSLFAMQMEQRQNKQVAMSKKVEIIQTIAEPASKRSYVVSGPEASDIHQENMQVLANMSEDEILKEQKLLHETLDPSLINFLQKRRKLKKEEEPIKMEIGGQDEEVKVESSVKEKLTDYIDEKWMEMGVIEKDKLEWIGNLPDATALQPDQPYSARFDFEGNLLPFSSDIDVRQALHHHGKEPQRAGYTVEELYQLCRSTVLQQRVLALDTLANILRKSKSGYYDECFDGQLLHKLVDSDIFFIIRFSLDEKPLVPVAIKCLHHLFTNLADEHCLDKLMGVLPSDVQPLLQDAVDASVEEEKEMKDHTVISYDMVKGVLRTDVLQRLSYIGTSLQAQRETSCFIADILTRIARHSLESCDAIIQTPNLLAFMYSLIACEQPAHQAVKFFRVLAATSKYYAIHLYSNFQLNIILAYIHADCHPSLTQHDLLLLKLESLNLWHSLLVHDLMTDPLRSYLPCFNRLLRFYVEKVNFDQTADYDFELYSGILYVVVADSSVVDSSCIELIGTCAEKWLTQLLNCKLFTYSRMKALGSIFNFFSTYYKKYGVTETNIKFITRISSTVEALLRSSVFDYICRSLKLSSHILKFLLPSRDPKNLPSLCSVYHGGTEFVKLVDKESCFAFVLPFIHFLKVIYNISHQNIYLIKILVSNENFKNYLYELQKCPQKENNWFFNFELKMVAVALEMLSVVNEKDVLLLVSSLLSHFRKDDPSAFTILSIICNESNWGVNVIDVYKRYLMTPQYELISSYKGNLIPISWAYEPLLEREVENNMEVAQILKFIHLSIGKGLFKNVTVTERFYKLCVVFLTDSYVFDEEIIKYLQLNFIEVLEHQSFLDLNQNVGPKQSFYDLYTKLVTQYAGVSYGAHLFALFIILPLQNRFDISYRKLAWSEHLHALRVVNLPFPLSEFPNLKQFTEPVEQDASLITTYLNALENNVIMPTRNPFLWNLTVENVRSFLRENPQEQLAHFVVQKLKNSKNSSLKELFGV